MVFHFIITDIESANLANRHNLVSTKLTFLLDFARRLDSLKLIELLEIFG